jgi:type II secretory pathway component GspD/PulD (secretin)
MREYRGFLVTTLTRALLPTLWLVLGAAAWSQETTDQRTITATYDGADIRQIISAVAVITGKKFIIHPDVDAQVTMDISTSVSVSAFYDIFLSILQTHGYEAVSREDVVHVVPVGTEPGAGSAPPEPRDTAKYIADSIRPTPYFVDGQMRGIRVYPGSNRVTFDAFGFEPGDLIIDYDGLPLADSRALLNFLNSLEASTIGYVTLDRNGDFTVIQMP